MILTIMIEHNVRKEILDIASSFYQKVVNVEESLCLPFQVYESEEYLGQFLDIAFSSVEERFANFIRVYVHLEICRGNTSQIRFMVNQTNGTVSSDTTVRPTLHVHPFQSVS